MDNDKLDSIIRKIKGLMALAEDNANEDEAQSAFVMAQKLMMKYNIEQSEIEDKIDTSSIIQGQATAYKTIFWQEKLLANIVAENFRVKFYYNNKRFNGEKKRKRTIMFYGLEQDVKIAKEMFVLANDAVDFYTRRFIEGVYNTGDYIRDKTFTTDLKNSYMKGFIDGLSEKMKSQRFALQEEFGLILLTPKIVEEGYEDFSKDFGKGTKWNIPKIEEVAAYQQGYEDGEEIDYTKSTVDDEIVC